MQKFSEAIKLMEGLPHKLTKKKIAPLIKSTT